MDENISNLCLLPGRPELYGVGIRTAFYIQWLGSLIIELLSEEHLMDMRFISVFSSAAALTALIIGAAQGKLHPLDVYFLLLFAMGFFLFLIPLRTWQLVTRCQPHLDPFFLSEEDHGVFYNLMTVTILAGNTAMGAWYYTTFLPRLDRDCWEVVFVLGKVDLENRGYHIKRLRILRVVSGLVVFTLLVLAIELPIYWNHIDNVTEFETLAQLIPFFLSIGLFFRSWALWVIRDRNQEQDWDDSWSTSVATSSIDPMEEYYGRFVDYGEYGWDYYWPHLPQWPPSVYYSARSS
ncbi:uncharacterized protein NECHADRAFT_43997 [Fusarium vanettenii 77-13-4]|uniref:Uncharacterized protein n=1 Tax=Fusarium vanettenii (strain ATCC MYA-4622 / CBS 123669 / FGSC 9596 / NRRL 45880 / 77-13-4) TaxID=660122 RepID=C7ZA48_FUSV7|nr:uncharacterized protein NECHADRAFT_43997 [Fusarium vanettenii 77-13-4]EEU39212.1 hypothetical protein NECHADRAFT_43997 [Fusarium vanettenii 77-13-4]